MRQAKMKFTFLICWASLPPCLILWILPENLICLFSFLGKIQYKKTAVHWYTKLKMQCQFQGFHPVYLYYLSVSDFVKICISMEGMLSNKLIFMFLLRPKMEYCLVCSILTAKDQSGQQLYSQPVSQACHINSALFCNR